MPLIAPLFIEDAKRTSMVTMVNDAESSLDVDLTLLDVSGDPLLKRTITIDPRSQKSVALADLLASKPSPWPLYGSIEIEPHRASTMAAQLSITGRDQDSGTDMEEEFLMMMDDKSADYRTVAGSSAPFVVARSLSTKPEELFVDCIQGDRKSALPITPSAILLRPKELAVVRACNGQEMARITQLDDLERSAGVDEKHHPFAISVTSSAPSSQLAVFGIGIMIKEKRLIGIPFTNRNQLLSSTQIYPGALFSGGNAYLGPELNLRAVLANFESVPKQAQILLSALGAQTVLQSLQLAPRSVIIVPSLNLPPNTDASLSVRIDGNPGDVVSNIEVVPTSSTSNSLLLPWKDQQQSSNAGQHPWRIDVDFLSKLMLYNPDPQTSSTVQLSVYANHTVWSKKIPVASLSTVSVSINDIVTKEQPDDKGVVLSKRPVSGLLTWVTLEKPKVFGMLVQSEPGVGLIRPYACAQTYAACGMVISTLNLNINGPPDNAYPTVAACGTQGDCNCIEQCGSGSPSSLLWAWFPAGDTSVAELVSSQTASYGQYQGLERGSTYSSATATDNLGCNTTGTGTINVNPYHLKVLSDGETSLACPAGYSGMRREISYEIDDVNGSAITAQTISVREHFDSLSPSDGTSTCNGSAGYRTETCLQLPAGSVGFVDGISAGCAPDSAPSTCGYTWTNQTWYLCGSTDSSIGSPGTLQATKAYRSVGGNTTGFPAGTTFVL